MLRNDLGLWNKEGALHQHMLKRFGLCHADDTGALIACAAHAKKNGKTYSPDADVAWFKRHWVSMGFDPATMERTGPTPKEMLIEIRKNGTYEVVI